MKAYPLKLPDTACRWALMVFVTLWLIMQGRVGCCVCLLALNTGFMPV